MTAVVTRLRRPWITTEYEHGLRLLPSRCHAGRVTDTVAPVRIELLDGLEDAVGAGRVVGPRQHRRAAGARHGFADT